MRLPSVRCRRPAILRPQLAGRYLFNTAHFKTGWHRQLRALLELASDLVKSAIGGLAAILISLVDLIGRLGEQFYTDTARPRA
jgi:hypothetical protein